VTSVPTLVIISIAAMVVIGAAIADVFDLRARLHRRADRIPVNRR
jgi:hypothetical protein